MPIKLDVPEELLQGIYANFMNVTFTEHEFVITFARIVPEEIREEARARAVARIVIPHHLMPRMVSALAENVRKYQEARAAEAEERATAEAKRRSPGESVQS